MADGSSAEIAVVGKEGIIGVALVKIVWRVGILGRGRGRGYFWRHVVARHSS
jgi:hypothetical protein